MQSLGHHTATARLSSSLITFCFPCIKSSACGVPMRTKPGQESTLVDIACATQPRLQALTSFLRCIREHVYCAQRRWGQHSRANAFQEAHRFTKQMRQDCFTKLPVLYASANRSKHGPRYSSGQLTAYEAQAPLKLAPLFAR